MSVWLDIQPHRVAKLSGIGCSSKTPDYFLGNSHGFNTVHGRMPSVLTGANPANRDLVYLGVSGDGDSASIGLGQFAATADKGSKAKKGATNQDAAIDTVSVALLMGATFVARSFSGDKNQLVPLVKSRSSLGYRPFPAVTGVRIPGGDASTKTFRIVSGR